ncbi:Os05g0299101 [Oryza sativa Japonica Group]|uniref:Os05g0299101 protein n=1 Tax=Oryza sativa subsp. japonica TaxID=39947 RepID=A0A0P0WKC8_ORYSJ|nr:hypothetical protein EE612_028426 [Oryza sativa]BAS93216.1 Os05g0299101 [Oryza sativa Japonica Group]
MEWSLGFAMNAPRLEVKQVCFTNGCAGHFVHLRRGNLGCKPRREAESFYCFTMEASTFKWRSLLGMLPCTFICSYS